MEKINIPVVIDAKCQLESLGKHLSTVLTIWKVNDAVKKIAWDVFKGMEQTREELEKLKVLLVSKLTNESLDWVLSEWRAKSQIIIDIINRNLFERTADIWFLSTDDDIRCFLSSNDTNLKENSPFIVQRLLDYIEKYSVYNNIYIFRPNWDFVLSANSDKMWKINDKFLSECQNITSWHKYHEYYWPTSFSDKDELLYSYKITKDNSPHTEIIWILVLSFDFENEMKTIFNNLNYWIPGTIMCLLDEDWKVLASNENNIHKWKTYKKNSWNYEIVNWTYWKYFSFTTTTKWYQWFKWLPWYGHTMIPLKSAFSTTDVQYSDTILNETEILKSKLVWDDLRELIQLVEKLNNDIKIMILNWHLIVNRENNVYSDWLKPVFEEVVRISNWCKDVFSNSIWNMFHLIIKNLLNNIKSISALWIDIMDRNLYERADDVRWWALTSKLRIILADKQKFSNNKKTIEDILVYIHELYTVYDGLYIYDKTWKIIAGTKLDKNGKAIIIDTSKVPSVWEKDFIKETLESRKEWSQFYSVSEFEKTGLYDNKDTYIYSAWIKSLEKQQVVWWICIVFDSQSQFHNMLLDILPKNNWEILPWSFWMFVNRNWNIISSTNDNFSIGTKIEISDKFLNIPNWNSYSDIFTLNSSKYIVWASCSKWYREYKTSEGYKNDVICLVFIRL